MEEGSLDVVHDNELQYLLQNLGVLDLIRQHKIKCKFCGTVITLENLHSLFPESGDIKIVCDKPACIKLLSQYINEKM